VAVRPSLHRRPAPTLIEPAPHSSPPNVEAETRPWLRSTVEGCRPLSRRGKRAAVDWLEPEAIKQLNMYAIQHDRNVQDIPVEANNDWFARKGLARFDATG